MASTILTIGALVSADSESWIGNGTTLSSSTGLEWVSDSTFVDPDNILFNLSNLTDAQVITAFNISGEYDIDNIDAPGNATAKIGLAGAGAPAGTACRRFNASTRSSISASRAA